MGSTVIAGYPWFSDWGRDTMIALPGLTLSTGRPDDRPRACSKPSHVSSAKACCRTGFRMQAKPRSTTPSMRRFGSSPPSTSTCATATIARLLDELYPTLQSIVAWHRRGTRFGIHVDPADGLLRAGEPGVQLTWMDAKIGDWVVTPRTGKAGGDQCAVVQRADASWPTCAHAFATPRPPATTSPLPRAVARSFNERFWFAAGGYLYDVVDGPEGDDASLRPNQILAVSLRHAAARCRQGQSRRGCLRAVNW